MVYRAKVKGNYIYDYSLSPRIDYSYLKKTKGIDEIEIITPYIPLYMGKFILRIIKRSISKSSFINPFKNMAVDKVLRKLNVGKIKEKVSEKVILPGDKEIECMVNMIGDGVVSLDSLRELINGKMTMSQAKDILQLLHIKKWIKINPLYGKKVKSEYCDVCDESCEDCFLGFSANEVLIYKNETLSKGRESNIHYKKSKIEDRFKGYVELIGEFYKSRKDNLVVVCPPMLKDVGLCYAMIFETLKNFGRVLYVTAPNSMKSERDNINRVINGASIHIFDGIRGFSDADILISSYMSVPAFREDFDLVILDDRISFPKRPYKNIFAVCKRALKIKGKFINVSVIPLIYKDKILKGNSDEIRIPPMNIQNPIPEPKFIISRYIDERTVYLPDISLDMVKWSLGEGSKVLIFTPTNRISIYLKNYLTKIEEISVSVGISSEKSRDDYFNFINGDKPILISSNYLDAIDPIYNINVVVMYSDSDKYSEDILLYMCSMANNHTTKSFREALFISKTEAENMNRAKSIVRSINKVAWENGYVGD